MAAKFMFYCFVLLYYILFYSPIICGTSRQSVASMKMCVKKYVLINETSALRIFFFPFIFNLFLFLPQISSSIINIIYIINKSMFFV